MACGVLVSFGALLTSSSVHPLVFNIPFLAVFFSLRLVTVLSSRCRPFIERWPVHLLSVLSPSYNLPTISG